MASLVFRRVARPWIWTLAGALGGAALARWQLNRLFVKHPGYEVERHVGALEIRVYDARWVAETIVADVSWERALGEGFRRLGTPSLRS